MLKKLIKILQLYQMPFVFFVLAFGLVSRYLIIPLMFVLVGGFALKKYFMNQLLKMKHEMPQPNLAADFTTLPPENSPHRRIEMNGPCAQMENTVL